MEEEQLTRKQRFKRYLKECWRVLRITKKPDTEEFKIIVKVTALGSLLIGAIGFVISMANQLIFR